MSKYNTLAYRECLSSKLYTAIISLTVTSSQVPWEWDNTSNYKMHRGQGKCYEKHNLIYENMTFNNRITKGLHIVSLP